jgi:sarcosine oxidase gamma subunit
MDPGRATITITRTSPSDVRVRQVYVSLDGKNVAELLYGESCTIEVAAGPHRLRANNTLVWKTLECRLEPGEHARFEVINRPGFGSYALLSLLGSGPIYLTFQRSDA